MLRHASITRRVSASEAAVPAERGAPPADAGARRSARALSFARSPSNACRKSWQRAMRSSPARSTCGADEAPTSVLLTKSPNEERMDRIALNDASQHLRAENEEGTVRG